MADDLVMVRWVVGSIPRDEPIVYFSFSFHPVLHNWCNKHQLERGEPIHKVGIIPLSYALSFCYTEIPEH